MAVLNAGSDAPPAGGDPRLAEARGRIQHAYSAWLAARGARPRPAQKRMIADVYRALVRGPDEGAPIAVVEAGTGTGKTLAYGLAAIALTRALGRRLVISTATVALQEQLVARDLPDLRRLAGLEFSFGLAKGRRRYVCVQRLDQAMTAGSQAGFGFELPVDLGELADGVAPETAGALLEALGSRRWNGDQETVPLAVSEREWGALTVDGSLCSGARCDFFAQCPFYRAREALDAVDVVVANHDLVLTHLLSEQSTALPAPEEAVWVFDEGHHLPGKLQRHARAFSRPDTLQRLLEHYPQLLERLGGAPELRAGVDQRGAALKAAVADVADALGPAREALAELLPEPGADPVHRFREGAVPDAVGAVAGDVAATLGPLVRAHGELLAWLEEALTEAPAGDPVVAAARDALRLAEERFERERTLWRDFADGAAGEGPPERARWLRRLGPDAPDCEAVSVVLDVGPQLAELLWDRCPGAVLTSATLTAEPDFRHFCARAGLPGDALYAVYAGAFDYGRSRLTIHGDLIPAGEPAAFDHRVAERLPELLRPGTGNLVLCTSRRQLRIVRAALHDSPALAALGGAAALLVQDDTAKAELLARHAERVEAGETSVLLGLQSFAEGIDLPGALCGHLVICKIPFAPPDDPVGAAEIERVELAGGDAFGELTLPEATLRLKQWVGRLVRTEDDTGDVTVLDGRLAKRAYGKRIVAALPPFSVRVLSG